jgi:hypothetical protein
MTRWLLLGCSLLVLVTCGPTPTITITSPANGTFTTASSTTISGTINVGPSDYHVDVNGTPVTVAPDKTWSVTLPLVAASIVNPFVATLARNSDGAVVSRDRIVVQVGDSIADGAYSPGGVGLRINDTGLDQIEPLIKSNVNLDLATLLPVGTVLINNQCFVDGGFLGCLGRATVVVASPPPTISDFSFNADSQAGYVYGDVTVDNVRVDVQINGSGLVPSCGLRLTAATTDLPANYTLQPDATDPRNIDVNLISGPTVSFSGFSQTYTSGVCDAPIIGDIIQLFIGSVENDVKTGLQSFLADPDGAGPLDSPLADAFESALAGVSIAGPVGDALQVNLDAPLFGVTEDVDGITLGSDVRVTSSPGTGPGQCQPPEGAPDLTASYNVSEAFPTFGATTPVNGLPYQMALAISTSAFNQLLKAQIECGLLRLELTEFDFGGGPVPLTAGTLALLIPEFSHFDPSLPMKIVLTPTLAPFLTGNSGPGGELGELRVGNYQIEVDGTNSGGSFLALSGAMDFRAGLDMSFDDATGSLAVGIGSVAPADVTVSILKNPVHTNEAQLQVVLPSLIAFILPQLGQSLGSFPLPSFLGLDLQGVEVSRTGQFYSLYANLVQGP